MTVEKVIQNFNMIKRILNEASGVDMLTKFKLLGIAKQFEPIIDNFESIRLEKIKEYGTVNQDGSISINKPERDKYTSDEDYEQALADFDNTVNKFTEDIRVIMQADVKFEFTKIKYAEIMNSGLSADCLLELYELID